MNTGDGQRIARLDSVTIDCHDPERLAAFWASVFGTAEEWRGGDPVQYIDLAGTDGSPVIRFQRVPEPKTVKDRIHLDLRVDDIEEALPSGSSITLNTTSYSRTSPCSTRIPPNPMTRRHYGCRTDLLAR